MPYVNSSFLRILSVFNKKKVCLTRNLLQLPDLPQIEVISISNSMEHNDAHVSIRKVKYGDFEFMECKEGYILCYIQAYLKRKEPQDAFYGVYYGIKSPL